MIEYFPVLFTAIALIIVLFLIKRWIDASSQKEDPSLKLMLELFRDFKNQIDSSTRTIDQKVSQSMAMFNTRIDTAFSTINSVQKTIGEFSEIGRSMKDLQEFLRSPKLRGNIGEQILKELLSQHLPHQYYQLQYSFKNGEKADAILKTSQGLISIDSKFPLENFKRLLSENNPAEKEKIRKEFERDIKKHIDDIAKKYIAVSEGTVDYALMYIPSESIYYEIINNEELYDFSGKKRVLPVSPMSFYAYIKAILMSFEGQRIQAQAKDILAILQAMKTDYEKAEEALNILTKHVTNAYNQTSQVSKNFMSIGQKLNTTHLLKE